jgi:hypothetical protein
VKSRAQFHRGDGPSRAFALGLALAVSTGCDCGSRSRYRPDFSELVPSASAPPSLALPPSAPSSGLRPFVPEDAEAPGPAVVPRTSDRASAEPSLETQTTGGRDATSPGGSVVSGIIIDSLVDVAEAGPATATERGVVMFNRENQLFLAKLGALGSGARPRRTALASLPGSAGPFPLAKAAAVRGGFAYWVSKHRLLRGALTTAGAPASIEVLGEDARVGTRVGIPVGPTAELERVPQVAAYVTRPKEPQAPLGAQLWIEGRPAPLPLSDEITSTHSVSLIATAQGVAAVFLEARTGMSSLHLRLIQFPPAQAPSQTTAQEPSLGEDRVIWVGGPSRSSTELLLRPAEANGALGLMTLERDMTHFGLLTLSIPLLAAAPEPEPDWLLYANGIEPAPVAALTLCGRSLVAVARPSSPVPDAPQELVLLELHRRDPAPIVLARASSFFSISLVAVGRGALLVYVADHRTWGRTLRCAPG